MKNNKHLFGILFAGIIGVLVTKALGGFENNSVLIFVVVFFHLLFVLNFLVRKRHFFKPYYSSRYNFISEKYKTEKQFDFSKTILIEKFKEILTLSEFKIIDLGAIDDELFATSSISLWSSGENIYIDFIEVGVKLKLSFALLAYLECIHMVKINKILVN